MFVVAAISCFLAWSIGIAVLQVPGGPSHLLLLLAGAFLGGHLLQRRRAAQRIAAHRALNPDRDHSSLQLRRDDRNHWYVVS